MPNKTYATQWLEKAYHDLGSAVILFKANHFTDTIGVDLHYALEKHEEAYPIFQKSLPCKRRDTNNFNFFTKFAPQSSFFIKYFKISKYKDL